MGPGPSRRSPKWAGPTARLRCASCSEGVPASACSRSVRPADLGRVTGRSAAGAALVGSIATWAEERPLPAVAAVAGALEVAVTVGGRSAAALEGLAGALRDQRDIQDEVVALSAQARLSALVVALAPLGSLGLSLAVDPRVTTTL